MNEENEDNQKEKQIVRKEKGLPKIVYHKENHYDTVSGDKIHIEVVDKTSEEALETFKEVKDIDERS